MSRETSSEQCFKPNRRAFLAGLAGTSLLAVGCGVDTYDDRLTETSRYYEYLEKVNFALGPKATPFEGIEIRVPKPFEQLVLPAAPAEGKSEEPPPAPTDDPNRLGYHPNVLLEGVIASWKANVRVDASRNEQGEAPAYIHLLSNLARWEEKQADVDVDPLRYLPDLINVLASVYNVQTETSDAPWPWIKIGSRDDERHRPFSPYVAKRTVEYIDIPPEDQPINAIFYKTETKDVQVALLLIYPRNIDRGMHLESRFKHTLEWLKLPSQPPQPKSKKPVTPSLF